MNKPNPIMQRIEQMTDLWEQFASDPAARLACWQLDHDSMRMFDLFLELQNEEASELPDLFIRFGQPLQDPSKFGFELRQSLIQKYDEIREPIAAEGIEANWKCPALHRSQDDVDALIAACKSLQKAHHTLVRHVVLALLPDAVPSPQVWREWLQRFVSKPIAEQVRFLVIDSVAQPQLADLAAANAERVKNLQPQLDMPSAYMELLRDIPGSGPAFIFRRFFVALGNAVSAGNMELARRLADQASRIASQQKWTHLETVVAMMLGAAYLGKNEFDAAIGCFRQGHAAVGQQPDDVSAKVAIHAKLAEASALVAASRPSESAKLYDEVRLLAKQSNDSFASLESARMSAYCHNLAGNRDAAWQSGLEALSVGESSSQRATLPYVGQGLLQIADGQRAREANAIRQRLEKVLGQSWDASLRKEALS